MEHVKNFADKVRYSESVECLCVAFAEDFAPLANFGWKGFVKRRSSGEEKIRAVEPHFMEVHMHLGHPVPVDLDSVLGFLLSLPRPVSIEVKIIMIGAPARPRFSMFISLRVGVGRNRCGAVDPTDIALTAVRVLRWVNDNDDVFQDRLSTGIGAGAKLICRRYGGFRR